MYYCIIALIDMSVGEIVLRLTLSGGLLWAAWADWQTRRVPASIVWGILAIGVGAEAARGHWASVVLLVVLLLDADRRLPRTVTAPLTLLNVLFAQNAGYGEVTIVWLIAYLLWDVVPLLGGGDAQLVMGLFGLYPDLRLVWGWLAAQAIVIPIVLIRRYRTRAVRVVAQTTMDFLARPSATPAQTTRIPGAVLIAIPSLIYLWVVR